MSTISGQSSVLGLHDVTDSQYEMLAKSKNHTYPVAPPGGLATQNAVQMVERVLGGRIDPTLTVDELERVRERIQVMEKREQQKMYQALSSVWMQKLAY